MAPPSSSSLPPPSHLFTPIQEGNEESEDLEEKRRRFDSPSTSTTPTTLHSNTDDSTSIHHYPTPLPKKTRKPKPKPEPESVSCTNCRPTPREKTSVSVVPVDNHHHHHHNTLSPLFKSIISTISRKSPKPEPEPEKNWRIMVSELSNKLAQATRRKEEALLESSRLKSAMAELEKKLNRLEVYCHNLKSGLDICHQAQTQGPSPSNTSVTDNHHDVIIKNFLVAVSDSRSCIRFLSKSLCSQLKLMGVKVFERLAVILKSYDFKISSFSYTIDNNVHFKTLEYYLEAVLSSAFYQDFESSGFSKGSLDRILNPIERCQSNYSDYSLLKDLTWDDVLNKGTKHFNEDFSRFCDRKMTDIVGLLGWTRAWPEQLLQAFFGASKSVWLVHLLANSVHSKLLIFRVDKGARFDPVYMEDIGGDKDKKKMIPTMVKIMVEPGFYVFDNVVKCKVITRYYNYNYNYNCDYHTNLGSGNDE